MRESLTNKREKWDKEWQKIYYSKLNEDDDIKHLIDQRNPENPRSIKSRRVSIEMSRELNSALDTAISLEAVGAELNGTYKEIIENQKRISFELEVQF